MKAPPHDHRPAARNGVSVMAPESLHPDVVELRAASQRIFKLFFGLIFMDAFVSISVYQNGSR